MNCDKISKKSPIQKETKKTTRSLDKMTREKTFQPREKQKKKTRGKDGQQMFAKGSQPEVMTQ